LLWQNGSVWVRTTNPVSDSETLLYFHVDALGSVRHGTNMSGASFARHDYGAFGEGPWTAGLDEKLRFTGAERDAETFLDYMGARYYRNVNGRFNTVDPGHVGGSVTDPQSWNAYAYARNNPLRFWDPTGTDYVIKLDGYASVQVSDATFHKLQDDPGAGLRLWLGNVQELRNGVWVTVGTYHYYDLIANVWRDAYNQSAPGVNAALAIGAVTSGGAIVGMGSVAVAGAGSMPLFGGLGGSMTATIAAIQNPAVRNAMNALYQFSDRIRGGTAAAVRFTADTLIKVGNSDHVLKAKERLASLERIVRNEPLTDSDKQLVNQVIGALKEALGWVRKKP